jgi:hypothetical protein
MNGQKRTFRREDTGEKKEFTRRVEEVETSTGFLEIDVWEADGRRIEQDPNGSFREQSGIAWVPV